MKRIREACLQQTIQFLPKEGLGQAAAAQAVKEERDTYFARLDRAHTKYKIIEEQPQSDGSIILKIKRQYNEHSCGAYMD